MNIDDRTIDRKFSELEAGTCFVMYSNYYMKSTIRYYDYHSDDYGLWRNYAINLRTGWAETVKDDEKVRVVNCDMIVS